MHTTPLASAAASLDGLDECLPAALRGVSTTITRIAAGLSGAGVYRVDADGRAYVLKIVGEGESPDSRRRTLGIQRLAAEAGLAPRIVHVDEVRRAVVSDFVVDRSFPVIYGNPATRDDAVAKLGRMVRRVHELPLPPDAEPGDPRAFLEKTWAGLSAGFALPSFVVDAVESVLSQEAPVSDRPFVLSHNDANPSNLVFDGEHLLWLDWETAAPNDPFYDLAVLSVFLRMDVATCQRLIAAYDAAPDAELPARFTYDRRVASALVGSLFLHLARQRGHPGARGTESIDDTPTLIDFYQRLRLGEVSLATADGQWSFGLALVKTGVVGLA